MIEETHGGYFRMKVQSNRQLDLAEIFRTMEENKERLDIFDYSVSQVYIMHSCLICILSMNMWLLLERYSEICDSIYLK